MKYMDLYNEWRTNLYFDKKTRLELENIKNDTKEIQERFYKNLEFGTAGLRGIIGAGINRINEYTVARATFGLANYIIKNEGEKGKARGVVIAHDNRFMSREFCLKTANTLAACGIKSYIFDSLRTTPELSFAVRSLNCIAGIVITASHNPPEYNGYKVYWEDGAQVMPAIAEKITYEINKINDFSKIPKVDEEQKKSVITLDKSQDEKFIEAIKQQCRCENIVKKVSSKFKIVYTPLCGTGNVPVRKILSEVGFENILVVEEEEKPDSKFSGIKSPNPEEKEALKRGIELAKKEDANLVVATDPDCDRVGVAIKVRKGEYELLTGNQIGALLVEYILKNNKSMLEDSTIIKTIVTSELASKVAKSYGVETMDVLTGFKFIGNKIKEFEITKEKKFIMGFEESYGYLVGTHARDKDGVVASMLISEMAAYYFDKEMTLYDALTDIYERFGYFKEETISITLNGIEGLQKIKKIMEFFRNINKETEDIVEIKDYLKEIDGLPKSNVIKFKLEGDNWIAIRPSGTEPKLKIYIGVNEISLEKADKKLIDIKSKLKTILDKLI
ncbi:MAG: phospho-sugar mutase [Paeniclostridium sordellii]|nr:phospho-sugar mutase [Paeniclostridium sordellii]